MSTLVRAWCSCGFHGEYTSEPKADYALRRHACARWEAKREKARRGVARRRRVAATRVVRDCAHTLTHHEHGTHAAYVLDRCHCRPCTDASNAYNRDLERRNAYGRSNLVDADPVREHVAQLAAARIGLKTLAARSGVAHGALWKLIYGVPSSGRPPSRRVRRATAEAILAVRVDALASAADGAYVPAAGAARRLRALVHLGWSVAKLAERSGVNRQALDPLLNEIGEARQTTAAHARAIARLYSEIWSTDPPETTHRDKIAAARSRARAAEAGWSPAAAWDDDTIDDPAALPAPGWRGTAHGECSEIGCPERAAAKELCRTHYDHQRAGRQTRGLLDLDDFAHLVRLGEHPARAAHRCGVTLDAVVLAARRGHRDDVQRLLDEVAAA